MRPPDRKNPRLESHGLGPFRSHLTTSAGESGAEPAAMQARRDLCVSKNHLMKRPVFIVGAFSMS